MKRDWLRNGSDFDSDPEAREGFIDEFPSWHGRLAELIDLIQADADPALVSGLLKSLGRVGKESFSESELSDLGKAASAAFQIAENPAVHSAAEWLMTTFELKLPQGEFRAANDSWYRKGIGSHSLTFVEINPAELPGSNKAGIDHRFYILTKEVSVQLFAKFVVSCEYQPEGSFKVDALDDLKKQGDLPIFDVSWFDAVRFCNWLSQEHGLTPAYLFKNEKPFVELDATSNGYRLPTGVEWETANRAGTESRFFFGESPERLRYYVVTGVERKYSGVSTSVKSCGTKMPNNCGLFDTLGNAYEWCSDGELVQNGIFNKWMRGGCASSDLRRFRSDAKFATSPNSPIADVGFRLVKSCE